MRLLALRALDKEIPVQLKLVVVKGSEEHGTGGLEALVPDHAEILRTDTNLVCDTGNAAVGQPAATVTLRGMVNVVVTVEALASEVHSGMFGGAAPDALTALVAMLASLRATTTATPSSGGWTTPRPGPARRTRPISSRVTPASWRGCPSWATAVSRT